MDRTRASLTSRGKESSQEIVNLGISDGSDNSSKELNHADTHINSGQEFAVSDAVERGSVSTKSHNQKCEYSGFCSQNSTVPARVAQDLATVQSGYSELQLPEQTQIGSKNVDNKNWIIPRINNVNNVSDGSKLRNAGLKGNSSRPLELISTTRNYIRSSSTLASKYLPVFDSTSQDSDATEQSQNLTTSWSTWWTTGTRNPLVNREGPNICASRDQSSPETKNLLSLKFNESPCPPCIESTSSTPWFSFYPALLLSTMKLYLETEPSKFSNPSETKPFQELPVIRNSSNTHEQRPSPHTWTSQANEVEQGMVMSGKSISSDDAILRESSETPINSNITRSENNLIKHMSKLSKQALFTTRDDMIENPRGELTQGSISSAQTQSLIDINPPNTLLPSLRSTYRIYEPPTVIEKVFQVLHLKPLKPSRRIFLTKDYPVLKKAIAIGIHGFFPAPLLRIVIGQPTGTSVRFANHASEAIRRWTSKHNNTNCEIEKIALEGEGKIADRVETLWKILLQWIDQLRKADLIFVACHSQGVPVAIMLVAKLIEFGVVDLGRICVCAMAGVSLGPFSDLKSRLFTGSAGELFEFSDPDSLVSRNYVKSLQVLVKYGVRVTFCGSIDDQVIPIESSVFSKADHPYLNRVLFIDARVHTLDFLTHLISFALKLRNLGVSDHGLLRELSTPLAGSLYTGEGHSRLYDEEKVYDHALEFSLQTTSVGDIPLEIRKYDISRTGNPYILPWIMRGLLEEEIVKTKFHDEMKDLLKMFDAWKPTRKALKDMKFRLEAIRSKL